ncbi:uncharacterized protein PV09_09843 [Verruconis gallopava]|uniref:DUF6589 domain-containing protein n=1 Tax=Verruconis gallopava TaxID=253628 RepID=A0A0D1YC87_9PEZI|nr:uncharacterized protein PV09_09843 [Verruconis gallopava]KIV98311.1 hypothetical protein PV09_09843 [Verruconis gallopava]
MEPPPSSQPSQLAIPPRALLGLFSSPLTSPISEDDDHDMPYVDVPPDGDEVDGIRHIEELGETDTRERTGQRVMAHEVIEEVLAVLRQHRWSFPKFIMTWAGVQVDQQIIINNTLYRTPAMRRHALRKIIDTLILHEAYHNAHLSSLVISTILAELDTLIQNTTYFGQYNSAATVEELDDIDFTEAFHILQVNAPTWYSLFNRLLQNQRSHRKSYTAISKEAEVQAKRLYVITSIVCHSRAKKQSDYLHGWLDIYLHGSGVKRRVIETLAGFGLCHSYTQVNRRMNALTTVAKDELRSYGDNLSTVLVYDNFNFKDTRRDEILGHTATMRAMTTAAIVICPSIPHTGLQQSMHNPAKPLSIHDVFQSPGISGDGTDITLRIRRFLIYQAIKSVHSNALAVSFANDSPPTMPILDVLPATKTSYRQFGATFEDEGTVDGTYKVHESLLLRQLQRGITTDDDITLSDEFATRLWLIHGDQLTSQRIRSVKLEQSEAERHFDRRRWLLGVPAWFHIQMNLLQTIVRTHWGTGSDTSLPSHCLARDLLIWGRSYRSRESIKYHQLEPSVTQSFNARILGLFYSAMLRRGYLPDDYWSYSSDFFEKRIAHLPPAILLEVMDDIQNTAFTRQAWYGTEDGQNTEFRSMCRLLQEVELFLIVRYAVKHGDIGLLRRVVDPLIIVFFGAGQRNYGREMIYYRWLLSPACSDTLQHAILASGLVNWQGAADTFKAIDLGLEHNNGSIKLNIQTQKNSTRDVNVIFDRMCLNNAYINLAQRKIEQAFGIHMPDEHISVSPAEDIFSLTQLLGQHGCFSNMQMPLHTARAFNTEDIYTIGMSMLAEQVKKFNTEFVQTRTRMFGDYTLPEDLELIPAVDIEDYVSSYQDEE